MSLIPFILTFSIASRLPSGLGGFFQVGHMMRNISHSQNNCWISQNMRLMACIIAFFIWQRKNLNSICRSYVAQMFLKRKKNFWRQGGQSIIFNNCPCGTLHFKCEIHFYFLVERSCTTRMSHELWPLHFLWQSIK